MVATCLVKDPSKRPTAEQLLQTPFFKGTKKKSYLINSILNQLPPLSKRQERRILPNPQNHRTVDSWDFTLHSAPPFLTPGRKGIDQSIVFDMEEEPPCPSPDARSKLLSGTLAEPAHSTHTHPLAPTEELGPVVVEQQEVEESRYWDVPDAAAVITVPDSNTTMEQTAVTVVNETRSISFSNLEPAAENDIAPAIKTLPIPIFTIARPTQPQENNLLISSSPGSVLTSSSTSPHSIISRKGTSSSPPRGGFWNKIKGKTSSNVRRVASLGGISHQK